jgi:hypothetical protein
MPAGLCTTQLALKRIGNVLLRSCKQLQLVLKYSQLTQGHQGSSRIKCESTSKYALGLAVCDVQFKLLLVFSS